jgi:uncharacterized repeat protein (TIGR02543 family)
LVSLIALVLLGFLRGEAAGASGSTVTWTANINSAGAMTTVNYTPPVSGMYTISSVGSLDTYGELLRASDNYVFASNDDADGVNNRNFKITFLFTAGVAYKIRVRLWSSSQTGSFSFSVSPLTYTLSYNANGGSSAPGTQTGQTEVISSTAPVRAGYVFKGWATSATASNAQFQSGGSITLTANTTLYAVWTAPTTMAQNTNYSVSIASPSQYKFFAFTPSISGTYRFISNRTGTQVDPLGVLYDSVGSYITENDDGLGDYNFLITASLVKGQTYYLKAKVFESSVGNDYSGNYTVKVMPVNFTLSYNLNGGSGGTPTTVSGQTVTVSNFKPTRFGYSFMGWAMSPNTTSPVYRSVYSNSVDEITLSDNITIYAVWAAAPNLTEGQSVQINWAKPGFDWVVKFTPSVSRNYHFYTSNAGAVNDTLLYLYKADGNLMSTADGGVDKYSDLPYYLTAGQTYYCKTKLYSASATGTFWLAVAPVTYPVSYNANSGSGAPAAQNKTDGTALQLRWNAPTKAGSIFMGWATSSSASNASYQPGSYYYTNASLTLYAVWHEHVWGAWTGTTTATCTSEGTERRVCLTDASHYQTRSISALGHSWGAFIVTKAATTTATGIKTSTCTHNAAHTKTEVIPKHVHSWGKWTTTKKATCTAAGTQTHTCSTCDAKATRSIAALGHSWGAYKVTKVATTTTTGVKTSTCTHNSAHKKTASIPKHVHSWGKWTTTKKATCTATGTQTYTCSTCGAKATRSIAALGHSWGAYKVTKVATTTTTGVQTRVCTRNSAHTQSLTIAKKQEDLPASIQFSGQSVTLGVGQKFQTGVTILPSNAPKTRQYATSNKSVATVDKNGLVTATGVGTAKITVSTPNKKSDTFTVTVRKAPVAVRLNRESFTIKRGKSVNISAEIDKNAVTSYTWVSANETVATVKNGVVTAKKAGKTTITVQTHNGKKKSCSVTVL